MYLSASECERFSRFRAPLRKREWLAGRLASKFLFLGERTGTPAPYATLSLRDLDRFRPSLYRSTEVRRDDSVRGGIPQVGSGARFRDVAISHTNGIACALLGNGNAVAVDMERVESRSAVFYRGNFTDRERTLVAELSRSPGLDPDWTFTLLWSIKECLLKTPAYIHLSIWDMPGLDLRIVSGAENLAEAHSAREFSGSFVFLSVEAASRAGVTLERVAVSGRYDLVLSAIRGVDRRTV